MIVDSIRGVAASGEDTAAGASIPHKRLLIAIAYVALSVAALWPVFATSYPPLIDLPNHLARLHILENIADDPVIAKLDAFDDLAIPDIQAGNEAACDPGRSRRGHARTSIACATVKHPSSNALPVIAAWTPVCADSLSFWSSASRFS